MYNRYRKAAHSRDSRNEVRRVAFVIGGIFDSRKLMVGMLVVSVAYVLHKQDSLGNSRCWFRSDKRLNVRPGAGLIDCNADFRRRAGRLAVL